MHGGEHGEAAVPLLLRVLGLLLGPRPVVLLAPQAEELQRARQLQHGGGGRRPAGQRAGAQHHPDPRETRGQQVLETPASFLLLYIYF